MSRVRRLRLVGALSGVLAVLLIIAGFLVWHTWQENKNTQQLLAAEQDAARFMVDYTTMANLNRGTPLIFGAHSNTVDVPTGTPVVTLIVDPKQLDRGLPIIGGDPSALIKAVYAKKLRVNLYLAPDSPDRQFGVDSLVKVASCIRASDPSSTSFNTLKKIADNAGKIRGTEDTKAMSVTLGHKPDEVCSPKASKAAVSAINNTRHFMDTLGVSSPGVIIAGGYWTDGINSLRSDWVEQAIAGQDARSFVAQ